jgi:hypothetical protein
LSKRRTRRPATFLAIVSLIAGGIVIAPSAASAQGGAVDQYSGAGPAGGSGDHGPGDAGTGSGGESAGTAESGGGSLPFTGYPLTPLAVVFLLLLAAGVAIRIAGSKRADVASPRSGPRLS